MSTLTAEEKYSLRNRNNLSQHIQLEWSKKEKLLSHFFGAYMKYKSNLEHFESKDNPQRLCILEIRDCKICG